MKDPNNVARTPPTLTKGGEAQYEIASGEAYPLADPIPKSLVRS